MGMPVPPLERAEEAMSIVLPLLTGRPERKPLRPREPATADPEAPDLFGGML